MKKILCMIAVMFLVVTTAGVASAAIMDYNFQGTVQAGSGYQMGSVYTTPLFVVGDTVNIAVRFNDVTNQVLGLSFRAGNYQHVMNDFTGFTVSNFGQSGTPVFDYNSSAGILNNADMRVRETGDNYPYWFIKYVDGSSNPMDKWFAFNTYTNNDTVNGFSLNTFSYTESQRLRFVDAHAVPVPAAIWLLSSGIAGLVGLRRKMRL